METGSEAVMSAADDVSGEPATGLPPSAGGDSGVMGTATGSAANVSDDVTESAAVDVLANGETGSTSDVINRSQGACGVKCAVMTSQSRFDSLNNNEIKKDANSENIDMISANADEGCDNVSAQATGAASISAHYERNRARVSGSDTLSQNAGDFDTEASKCVTASTKASNFDHSVSTPASRSTNASDLDIVSRMAKSSENVSAGTGDCDSVVTQTGGSDAVSANAGDCDAVMTQASGSDAVSASAVVDGCDNDDDGSDWEGPVDVELEESPLAAKPRRTRKVTWKTLRAVTRWMPMSRAKHPWTQMAGHQGSFLAGGGGTVLKLLVPREETNLQLIMAEQRLSQHAPQYRGTVDKDGERYVQLQDLLCEFTSPCVMDIKMGVRTYLEEELEKARKKPSLRKDLFQKMVSIDLDAPTPEEKRNCAVIKPRYMQFRDDMSSTSSLGFRIEGIKTQIASSKDYKDTRSRDDVTKALGNFIGDNTAALGQYISKLSEISEAQAASDFCQSHEMVGSSLLFVHDARGRAGLWMIDFAKCCRLPTSVHIDHRSRWVPGNYEDGYLFGLDNLKSIFEDIRDASSELTAV